MLNKSSYKNKPYFETKLAKKQYENTENEKKVMYPCGITYSIDNVPVFKDMGIKMGRMTGILVNEGDKRLIVYNTDQQTDGASDDIQFGLPVKQEEREAAIKKFIELFQVKIYKTKMVLIPDPKH